VTGNWQGKRRAKGGKWVKACEGTARKRRHVTAEHVERGTEGEAEKEGDTKKAYESERFCGKGREGVAE